jgi:hypothetical protein
MSLRRTHSLFALALLFFACAHTAPAARRLAVPARDTPWLVSVTALGSSIEEIDAALQRSFEANPHIARVERAQAEGHIDLTVQASGEPLTDGTCVADVHIVVYRRDGTTPILDQTAQLTEECRYHTGARDALFAQAAAWGLERGVVRLSQAD